MMSAAVAGTTFRPTPSYTTLRDVTVATHQILAASKTEKTGGLLELKADKTLGIKNLK